MATATSVRLFQHIFHKVHSHVLPKTISSRPLSYCRNGSNIFEKHHNSTKPVQFFSSKFLVANLRTNSITNNSLPIQQEVVEDTDIRDNQITKETVALINDQISKGEEGRLFAIIHVLGKHFKITQEDVIVLEGYWAPQIGDKIKLEKVLLLGSSDFTLIGRPVLPRSLVSVTATVIDKDLSKTKTKFFFRKRKQFRRINFLRSQLTMLRINEITIVGRVNEREDVEGLDQIFH